MSWMVAIAGVTVLLRCGGREVAGDDKIAGL